MPELNFCRDYQILFCLRNRDQQKSNTSKSNETHTEPQIAPKKARVPLSPVGGGSLKNSKEIIVSKYHCQLHVQLGAEVHEIHL